MYYTKNQLINKLQKHYNSITVLTENNDKITLQADQFKIDCKKVSIANFDGSMVLRYQY